MGELIPFSRKPKSPKTELEKSDTSAELARQIEENRLREERVKKDRENINKNILKGLKE